MTDKRVEDLMLSLDEYATVSEDSTLQHAFQALSLPHKVGGRLRHCHRAVLVLDRKGTVVGKLTHWALLRSLEPELLRAKDLHSLPRAGLSPDFLRSILSGLPVADGSFVDLCRAAARIPVTDVMVPDVEHIDADVSITEAIRLLVLSHAQSSLVHRGGKTVGLLRLTDVFEEVANTVATVD